MSTIIESRCTIKHLNIRKQGPEDDKVLAIDVKLSEAVAGPDLLARLLGSDEATVRGAFWDDEGEPRFSGLEPLQSWADISGCSVRMGGMQLHGCDARKFKAAVRPKHQIEVELQVSVTDPPEKAVPILADYVMDELKVVIEKEQMDLDLEGDAA